MEQDSNLRKKQDSNSNQPPWWRIEGMPQSGGETASKGQQPKKRGWAWWLGASAILYLGTFGILTLFTNLTNPTVTVSYTEFISQVEAKNVEQVYAKGDTIEGTLRETSAVPDAPNVEFRQFVTERPTWATDDLFAKLEAQDTKVSATSVVEQPNVLANLLFSLLPLLFLVMYWRWMIKKQRELLGDGAAEGMLSSMGGMFGKSRKKPVDPESVRVTFDDVAGIDEVEEEISEIVDYLKNPDKYKKLGAHAPKGVLLSGQPGTGKTLLARATAGEAGVPFFSASASEFIEMVVGVGAQRVRELFSEARKVAPSIIFIDEIDTIGKSRSGSGVGGHDEREQTLNQILTEMDGFSGSEGVVVLAATNRAEILDAALTRPGRFDRTITVNAPDLDGREAILKVHSKDVPLAPGTDLAAVAKSTPGMTGAELANLINEAALLAARAGASEVTNADLANALEKIQLGTARHVVMPEDERNRTAYHEAGHALLGMLQPGADPVRKISIIPRGRALGVTLSTPEADRYGYTKEYLEGRIVGALGGMAAEETVFGVITTGAESDLQSSTSIARQMVGRWGMSEKLGPVQIYSNDGDPASQGFSQAILADADAEARRIIDECYARAKQILLENRDKLDGIVEALLEKETLDEREAYEAAGVPMSVSAS